MRAKARIRTGVSGEHYVTAGRDTKQADRLRQGYGESAESAAREGGRPRACPEPDAPAPRRASPPWKAVPAATTAIAAKTADPVVGTARETLRRTILQGPAALAQASGVDQPGPSSIKGSGRARNQRYAVRMYDADE